jgi:hypothetical protein
MEHLRRGYAQRAEPLGGSIRDLKVERDPPDVDDLGDEITAPEVIRDVHLLPGFWRIDGYRR